jgi:type II secretory pathway component PulF
MAMVTPTRVATVPSRRRRRVSFQDLTVMTRQLASLVGGGLTLMQSIDALIEHTENERLASALMQIREELRGGGTFAEALTKHPHLFSPLYVSIVRAGEVSGELPRVLNWLADYMEREQTRRTQIRSALAYPILLSIVMVIALSFLLIFLVPATPHCSPRWGKVCPCRHKSCWRSQAFWCDGGGQLGWASSPSSTLIALFVGRRAGAGSPTHGNCDCPSSGDFT